ncbi:PHP domain-containing protein [Paracholeplasma manati]|uniref:PHP domain-containing protein n=1 Tax=Paracholeplasma manati TaxID=591373 RepID=A0ABT2Y7R5_9MOLU|nr:PHP domain-containing protein [Paracholeplasma manati]MCV2232781.1 PHP domain-containing protein [Paracholeplasma manati]MDG0887911.1 PHP domain-containing protein [Paracholeplasma manati]
MTYAYDLHIHSVLSPCGDVLMTPNNIFNMATLKGLDIIAITDHNSLKQLKVCHELSQSYDLLFIPGVEITVKEDFDVLCYFKHIDDALAFDLLLEQALPKIMNQPEQFGEQYICDIHDDFVAEAPYLLINPIEWTLQELIENLKAFPHILIYAHLDKKSRSGKDYVDRYTLDGIEFINPELKQAKNHFKNSDAHQIIDISERTEHNQIELDELTIEAFFRYFHHD